MTRVTHTGDTHVGYQQYHSPERRRDFLDAFEQVVDDAVESDVDAVVHAGDLFHDRRPDLPDLLGVLSALRTLDDAGIPFLAVVGNHESTRGGEWLDLFAEMGLATRLGPEPEVVGDVALYGLDWVPRSRRDELDYRFEPHDQPHAALVAHGLFTPFAHADWDTETVLEAATVDFDAVLLGDNHAPDTAEVLDTWVTYCGSTERASASEREARGYNLVTFGDEAASEAVDIRRRSLDTREFVFVEVDLAEGEGVERVREQVRQHDLEGAVTIVEVTGDGEPITPASVEEAATEAGALVVRVTDRRETEDREAEVQVSFADPDEAVRERVGDLGLSPAARDVDETVRASKVADSNVRAEIKERVQELLDEGTDPFEPGEPVEAGSGEDGSRAAGEESGAAEEGETAEGSSDTATDDDTEPATADGDGEPATADDTETATADGDGEPATADDTETATADGDGEPATADGDAEPATADGDAEPAIADDTETADGDAEPATANGDEETATADGDAETANADGDEETATADDTKTATADDTKTATADETETDTADGDGDAETTTADGDTDDPEERSESDQGKQVTMEDF